MAKRAQNRGTKAKTRARRPQTRPVPTTPAETVAAVTETATPPHSAVPTTGRRATARRLPAVTINYAYLQHDLRTLGILAPAMVVLLVIAYVFFHAA